MNAKLIDMTERRFGRLVVQYKDKSTEYGAVYWKCKCDCGNIKNVQGSHLRNGSTRSCGCFRKDRATKAEFKHGLVGTPEYCSWAGMKDRCYNQNNKRWGRYGARGIKVYDRWRDNFENFISDMGKKPSSIYSIDRKNNDGDYEPKNCRWATPKQQANNRGRRL